MNYDFKEGCYIDIPLGTFEQPLISEAYLENARKELEYKALSGVIEHAKSEHGVNIKLAWHEWRSESFGYPTLRLGVVAYLSFPKEQIMKVEPFDWKQAKQQEYHCVWCGAKNPNDDQYHSGTCENCGGPKL